MTLKWLQRRSWDDVFRKRVPGVGSGNRKSSAADGSQSDWRHDQTVSSGRTQSSISCVNHCLLQRWQWVTGQVGQQIWVGHGSKSVTHCRLWSAVSGRSQLRSADTHHHHHHHHHIDIENYCKDHCSGGDNDLGKRNVIQSQPAACHNRDGFPYSFYCHAPVSWNALTPFLCDSDLSIAVFRLMLKIVLFYWGILASTARLCDMQISINWRAGEISVYYYYYYYF